MKLPTNCENGILHTYRRKPSLLIGFSANESVPEKVCLIATQTQCVTKGSAGLVLQKEGDAFTPSSQSPSGTPSRFARYVPVSGTEPLAPGLYDLWVCDDGENCSLALDNDPVSAGDSNDAEPDRSGDDPKIDGTVEVNSVAATGEEPTPPGDAGQPTPHRLQVCIHHFLYPVLPCPPAASAAGETEAPQPGTIAPPSEIVVGPDGKLCFFVDDTIDKTHYVKKYEIQVGTKRIVLEPKSARGETDKDRLFWLEAKLQKPLPPSVTVYYNDNNHSTSIGCCTLRPYNSWGTKLQPILVSFLKDIALGENGAGNHSGKLWNVRADYPDIKEVPVVWNIKNRTQLRTFLVPEDLDPAAQAAQMTIAQLWRKEGLRYWSTDDELGGKLVINSQKISDDFTGYYKFPAEWQLQSKLSEWLSTGPLLNGNKGSFLVLHLHHPVVFPLWGGEDSFQSALLNILGVNTLSAASDKVHYAVSLRQHLECLIESDPEVRYWFSKSDTDLHFDYVTDFVVYTDNPYVRGNELYARLRDQKQVILYGPPGTGKTYRAKTQTEWMIDWWLARDFGKSDLPPPSTRFWKMIQFHPAYTYEDFIQGLRPTPQGGGLAFEVKDGHFKVFCESAGIIERLILEIKLRLEAGEVSTLDDLVGSFNIQDSAKLLSNLEIRVSTSGEGEPWELKVKFPERHGNNGGDSNRHQKSVSFQRDDFLDSSKLKKKLDEIHLPPFVFIIDEINRANLSAVLGELMYCLEYRGPEHARKLPLAHLQTEEPVFTLASRYFFVPRNVFVVGTMNTIDKSTERVDFALRRRFGWWKCDPEPSKADAVMRRKNKDKHKEDWTVRPHLEALNKKLRDDLRRMGGDFQIGEAYFFDLPKYSDTPDEALKQLWELQLRSVLEDFYGDARQWEKNEAALRNIVVTGKSDGNASPPSGAGVKDWETISKVLKIKPQAILYGPPGTGKTWAVSEDEGRKNDIPEERFELIQFHPAYTYEDFLQGLRPIPVKAESLPGQPSPSGSGGNGGTHSGIRYEVRPGLFKRICRDAGRFERGLFEILAPLKEGQWGLREKDKLSTDLCCSEDGTHNGDGWKNAYGLGWVWCGRMNSEQMSVFLHIDHGDSAIKLVFSCSNQTKPSSNFLRQ